MTKQSLYHLRLQYQPQLPKALKNPDSIIFDKGPSQEVHQWLSQQFPHTSGQPILTCKTSHSINHKPLKIGVVLSGGQAAGGHNVITGLFDALQKLNPESTLIGFLNGPSGIINNHWISIDKEKLASYRNTGGFDLIGSGRTKIETPDQFVSTEATVRGHHLDGLVIIGGDDSNTNAAFLAEYFLKNQCPTRVIGVPKTIDGDLQNEFIEISFGFDTATKTYSEIIANIARDAMSAKKSYYFIKVMGRSASHIALECALRTHPNLTLISEEVASNSSTLQQVIRQISDTICKRALKDKNYGVVVIPEGIIEFIPEMRLLVEELNHLMSDGEPPADKINSLSSMNEKISTILTFLSSQSASCFQELPKDIQNQMLMDRDPHGNVQVSKIETERMFIELVDKDLKKLKNEGLYNGKFSAQPFFCGYEGRSAFPSNFDSQYCYALGYVAALLIDQGATGYMSCLRKLHLPVVKWEAAGIPLTSMMALEKRGNKSKAVITKALVNLHGKAFEIFKNESADWKERDAYVFTGPIQFYGPEELTEEIPLTMTLPHSPH